VRLEPLPRVPPGRSAGTVDGAWWLHTDELGAELPELLTALSARLDTVVRVFYDPDGWASNPTRLAFRRRTVRLDRDRLQQTATMSVIGVNATQVVLLVVPPHTDPDRAYTALTAAAAPGEASTVADLLAISSPNGPTARHLQPASSGRQ